MFAYFIMLFVGLDVPFAQLVEHLLFNTSSLVTGTDTTQLQIAWNPKRLRFRNAFRYFTLRGGRQYACGICPSAQQQRVGCAWITAQRLMMVACGIPVDRDVAALEGVQGQAFVGALGILFGLAVPRGAPHHRLYVKATVLARSTLISHTLPSTPEPPRGMKCVVEFDSDAEVTLVVYLRSILSTPGAF